MSLCLLVELQEVEHLEAVEADSRSVKLMLTVNSLGFINFFQRSVIGKSWVLSLAPVFQDKVGSDSKKRRSYSGTSVVDLLRFVRNMAHHYHELAPDVRRARQHCRLPIHE